MANQYKNKVIYGNQTLMDITDTTATENDVLEGEVFYSASGARSIGTLGDATTTAHGLMSASDKIKLDGIDLLGVKLNTSTLTPDANGYVTIPIMTGATSNAAGTTGLVPAPGTGDVDKFLAGDGTYKSGGLPMVILSYGNSTWADFEAAYKNNVIVYCRASSNSNPATGTQGRMAFMAYTNNGTDPTEVEFQYYRSVSTHKSTQMGDEVYVYKLNKTSGWSVTKRLASIQSITGTGITVGYTANTNVITLTNDVTVSDSLTDTSTTAALSAAKGKALNDRLEAFENLRLSVDSSGYICQTVEVN